MEELRETTIYPDLYKKDTDGKGNGLFTSKDIASRAQILHIDEPLIIALNNNRLDKTCYQCFRGTDLTYSPPKAGTQEIELKVCTGCRIVKFCDKQCQKMAWNRNHKFECKLFAKLSPRILPTSARALIRLLKRRAANLISDKDWNELVALEGHQDEMSTAGGQKWQDLFLLMKAIKAYSGTGESPAAVLDLCAKFMINSFTLVTSSFDHIGEIMHPYAALANHSCEPNAAVRFDSGPFATSTPLLGRISFHALRDIKADEEITISYIDITEPYAQRQHSLKSRYFFTCSCNTCTKHLDTIQDRFLGLSNNSFATSLDTILHDGRRVSEIQSTTEALLQHVQAGSEVKFLPHIREALSTLGKTGIWPIHRYPCPQLRHLLLLGLIDKARSMEAEANATEWFFLMKEAIAHSTIICAVDSLLFRGAYFHPVAVAHNYTRLSLLVSACSSSDTPGLRDSLWELARILLSEMYTSLVAGQVHAGHVEKMLAEEYASMQKAGGYEDYMKQPDHLRNEAKKNAESMLEGWISKVRIREGRAAT